MSELAVNGMPVEVVRKPIKNLHLSVLPPNGKVRVAVPRHVTDERVRLAVISRLGWIRRQQLAFQQQPRQSAREMHSGESHFLFGRRYRLGVIEAAGRQQVSLKGSRLLLQVLPGATVEKRKAVLNEWYRQQLKERIPALLAHWQKRMGVVVKDWGVKKMKTRWGSCNAADKRIWLNLELAKKPPECLEYILVHELVHLKERHHNERFRGLMNNYLPDWELRRATLNRSPLANEKWGY
jgi:predicted metal-dependent hydrolase